MSKKKTKKFNTVKKKYSIASLTNDVRAYDQKLSDGEELSEHDEKLYQAMEQVLEFTKSSHDYGIKLDLNMETEKNQDVALMRAGLKMQEEGNPEDDIINNVMSIASQYQLFQLVNLLVRFNLTADIVTDDETGRLIVKGNMPMNPNTVTFDPYTAMENVKDKCFIFRDVAVKDEQRNGEAESEMIRAFGVSLGDYRDIVVKDLLERF